MSRIWNTKDNHIPQGWSVKKLPEIARIEMGQSPSSATYNNDRIGLPFFQGKTEFGEIYPTINKFCSKPVKIAEEGSVLLSVRAPVGPTNLARTRSCIGRGLAALHPLHGMSSKFLLLLLRSVEPELSTKGTGSTFKAVTKSFIEGMEFVIPDLPTQEAIVVKIEEIFSELDSGIASLKAAKQQLSIYRQSLLKHAFEGELTEQWRKDNADKLETCEQLLARIQYEREARYQQQLEEWQQAVNEWEMQGKEGRRPRKPKNLSELKNIDDNDLKELPTLPACWSYIHLGKLIDDPVYGTSAKCSYEAEGVGVLRIPNIVNGIVNDSDLKFAEFGLDEAEQLMLQEGDLLTIRSNGSVSLVGSCAIVKEQDTKHVFAGYLIRLRANQKVVRPDLLLFAMSSHLLRKQIEQAAKSTSGVNNINSGELQNLILPIMSIGEQQEVVSKLEEKLSIIEQNEKEIESALAKAKLLRQSILKKALSGCLQ